MSSQATLTTLRRTQSLTDLQQLLCDVSTASKDDRRSSRRVDRTIVLVVQPLDDSLQPIGQPFKAMTRDISADGLGFTHPTPFPTPFVEIRNNVDGHRYSIARVCYNRAFCDEQMNYLIGVQFQQQL